MTTPFISICIPAYKRVNYLKRLLNSIEIQLFKNFEIIISDDSDDNSVFELIEISTLKDMIKYYKNEKSLGTPANWNYAISKANGEWIKIMHDDDWFTSELSLKQFYNATFDGTRMIVSGYSNFFEKNGSIEKKSSTNDQRNKVLNQPLLLLSENIIGPPSVIMVHKDVLEKYDERLKWRVDLEFYVRVILNEKKIKYIEEDCVRVGISESQVTNYCINIPYVEIPEAQILISKFGTKSLRNIVIYDAWWRIFRNCKIRNEHELINYSNNNWPKCIFQMVRFQSKFKISVIKIGPISKMLMLISYLKNIINKNI